MSTRLGGLFDGSDLGRIFGGYGGDDRCSGKLSDPRNETGLLGRDFLADGGDRIANSAYDFTQLRVGDAELFLKYAHLRAIRQVELVGKA